jgi:hypothetical protein
MTKTRLISTIASLALVSPAFSQFAQLADGTIVTQKVPLEIWSVEGPIWNVDLANYQIGIMGRVVTIPASYNGEPFAIAGTEIINSDGQSFGGISVDQFDRLTDLNALIRDVVVASSCDECGPLRMGPVRSIYSSSEARSASVGGTDRSPEIQRIIEDNYFNMGINLYARYMDVLPASWLGKLGVRNAQGQYPASPFQLPPRTYWKYPATTGATLKSAGEVFIDVNGNEYLIPNPLACGIEFAENVVIGAPGVVRRGDEMTPDSFLMGDLLVTLNPDPRIEVAFLGVGGAHLSQATMFELLESGTVAEIGVGGYQVGEHMMFATVIEGEDLYHPSMGIVVTADRFDVRIDRGEIRFRGVLAPAEGNSIWAEISGQVVPVPFVIDPLNGFGIYDVTLEGLNLGKSTLFDLVVRNAKGAEIHRATFDFSDGIRP